VGESREGGPKAQAKKTGNERGDDKHELNLAEKKEHNGQGGGAPGGEGQTRLTARGTRARTSKKEKEGNQEEETWR